LAGQQDSLPGLGERSERLALGIDTCGPMGSVALGRMSADGTGVAILGQTELAGRSYSATLVSAMDGLLKEQGIRLNDVGVLVAVSGPGSFTGVRVGLSAAKGLAEATGIRIVAVSRLEVLAAKAGVDWAAIDAHRSEVFLRVGAAGEPARELLAGGSELAELKSRPERVAVCDDAAQALLQAAWPGVELVRTGAATAADALRLAVGRVKAGQFIDPLALDGHYLRRSDAEISATLTIGEPGTFSEPAGVVRKV